MILCVFKAGVAAIVLWLVCMNLVGFMFVGLNGLRFRERDRAKVAGTPFEAEFGRRYIVGAIGWTLVPAVLLAGLLFMLTSVWSAVLAIAASMLMVARTTDLLFERTDPATGRLVQKPPVLLEAVGWLLIVGSVPVIWRALCR